MGTVANALLAPSYVPRTYQFAFHRALARWRFRHYALVWPRRHGKDRAAMNGACDLALDAPMTVWHAFPEYEWAREGWWKAVDANTGRRCIADILDLGGVPNETDMTVTFPNGSIYRMVGSDRYDRRVGAPPKIIIYSEAARMKPQARAYFLPILVENRGVEILVTTAYGPGWFRDLYEGNRTAADWFTSFLTIEHTRRDAPGEARYGEPVVSAADLAALRAEYARTRGKGGMSEEMIRQEFFNSFEGVQLGAILGTQLDAVRRSGRASAPLPVLSHVPAHSWWDLGRRHATCVWITQQDGPWFNVIGFLRVTGADLAWVADALARDAAERGYKFGGHHWPHDGAHVHFGHTETRRELGQRLLGALTVHPVGRTENQIESSRAILARCRFDAERCAEGLDWLAQYKFHWDRGAAMFSGVPEDDEAKDPADAFATFAMHAPGAPPPERAARGDGAVLHRLNPHAWQGR